MTISGYRFGIRLFTLFGLMSMLVFVLGMDPMSLSRWGMVFFFVSFWVSLGGLFSLSLLFLYEKMLGKDGALYYLGSIFRQAILLGTYGLSAVLLLYFHLFTWWIAVLVFLFFVLLEFTFRRMTPAHK